MSAHDERLAPVGGRILTPTFVAVGVFSAFAMLVVLWRFVVGIGGVSALNDGYSWGSWKVFNVIVLTALGSGGYATAVLVYFLNRQRYHGLARVAIVTSVLGYTTGVLALGMDIGRPWNFWVILKVWEWNLHSVLLEIAVCVSLYLVFLWIEMAMPVAEHWKSAAPRPWLRDWAERMHRWLERGFPWIVAMAILLPTMHQSSLGSLFLLAGPRLHPLWNTDFLPLLFLLSAFFMGWATVVMVAQLSAMAWKRPMDMPLLAAISRIMGWVIVGFLALRWADILWRGALGSALAADRFALVFLVEMTLLVAAAAGLLAAPLARRPDRLFRLAMAVAAGGSLYRLNSSLIGFLPGEHWSYFPSVLEMVISLGFVGLAVVGYQLIVKHFPILAAAPGAER